MSKDNYRSAIVDGSAGWVIGFSTHIDRVDPFRNRNIKLLKSAQTHIEKYFVIEFNLSMLCGFTMS